MPKRIQRRRTKGWRMPKGAVYVGRPGPWSNPYRASIWGQRRSVGVFEALLRNPKADNGRYENHARWILRHLHELRDKDLVCWCPLVDERGKPVPCHADVLLELANAPEEF